MPKIYRSHRQKTNEVQSTIIIKCNNVIFFSLELQKNILSKLSETDVEFEENI